MDNRSISFVVPVKTTKTNPIHGYRIKHWTAFLMSLQKFQDKHFELVIAYYPSDDILNILETAPVTFPYIIVPIDGSFYNKSMANNQAVQSAHGDILFFPDMDLTFPPDACQTLRAKIKPGQGFWPIWWCEAGPDQPAMWRVHSYFVCGLTRDDFAKMGGFNVTIAKSWGGDEHTTLSAQRAGVQVIREKWKGITHHYHPNHCRNFYHELDDKAHYQ